MHGHTSTHVGSIQKTTHLAARANCRAELAGGRVERIFLASCHTSLVMAQMHFRDEFVQRVVDLLLSCRVVRGMVLETRTAIFRC